ncbi:MAG: tetratricopeptide repeat protein, partial [Myxococcaceae bacterium]
ILGIVQAETGRPEEALTSLKLAVDLAPDNAVAQGALGRVLALTGDSEGSQQWFGRLPKQLRNTAPILQVVARVAAWSGNFEHYRALFAQSAAVASGSMSQLLTAVARRMMGESGPAELNAALEPMAPSFPNHPRVAATLHELAAEAEGIRGDIGECLKHLAAVRSFNAHDLLWLQRCPALACVRGTAEYQQLEAEAVAAARQIWTA